MTKAERDALRALEAKATPGPVGSCANGKGNPCKCGAIASKANGDAVAIVVAEDGKADRRPENERLLIAARNSLVALLDALDDADELIYAVNTWLLKSIHVTDDARHFVDGTLYDHISAYNAKRRGGPAVAPPRPAPTTVPSSGVPRQDSGRPKIGGGG